MQRQVTEELFAPKSTCRIRLQGPPPCNGSFEEMMAWIMCKTWYSPIRIEKGIILVESFRENIKKAFEEYRGKCSR